MDVREGVLTNDFGAKLRQTTNLAEFRDLIYNFGTDKLYTSKSNKSSAVHHITKYCLFCVVTNGSDKLCTTNDLERAGFK